MKHPPFAPCETGVTERYCAFGTMNARKLYRKLIAHRSDAMRIFPLAVMLTFTGCATSPAFQERHAAFTASIPTCIADVDCKAKWEAAQLWVIHHSAFKIQLANDVLIETYSAVNGDPKLAARVTKEPMGGGKYQIIATLACANLFGCVPNAFDTAMDFNRTISAVTP